MKLLIIGVSGMLGQTLFKVARQQSDIDVYGTVRRRTRDILDFLQTEETRIFECDLEVAVDPLLYCSPDVVINCAGIIKQHGTAQTALSYIRVNALAPYILAEMCEHRGRGLFISVQIVSFQDTWVAILSEIFLIPLISMIGPNCWAR